jgi:uncharacterized protein YdeI (YjbR/CyaY-like superfamily)
MAKRAARPPADAVKFFATPAALRRWFENNHDSAEVLWVGFHKRDSGKPSVTWQESVDEALCVGWIDGIRKRIDEASYKIRFTPRRPRSIWSAVNASRVAALKKEGRMRPAGLAAFAKKLENRSGIYSYEQRPQSLPEEYRALLSVDPRALEFFDAQPPGYRKLMAWYVVSAKKEETRAQRVARLLDACRAGKRL